MIAAQLTSRHEFDLCVHLLLELHQLTLQGNDESEEGDRIRDAMDAPWYRLNEDETKLLRGLSADLYTIGIDRSAQTSEFDRGVDEEFASAVKRADWQTALERLRENATAIEPAEVAFIRGACWAWLAQPNVAVAFFHESARHKPLDPDKETWLLTCLIQADRLDDAVPRAREIAQDETDALLLLKAAEILFVWASRIDDSTSAAVLKEAIEVAQRGLELAKHQPVDETLDVARTSIHLHIALSYEMLGHTDEAVTACKNALELDPENVNALMLLGYLSYPDFPRPQKSSFRQGLHSELARTSIGAPLISTNAE